MTVDPKHLVVRAPNWVGDLVMATPVLYAALESRRWEQVSIVVRGHLAALFDGSALSEYVVPLERGKKEAELLRELEAGAVLLLVNSLGAAWRAFRAGIPLRAGAALGGRRALLTHAVVPPAIDGRRVPIPTAHLHRDLAGLVGLEVPSLHPRLTFDDELAGVARERLAEVGVSMGEPYFLCAPGAAFGAAKLWPPEFFAEALTRIAELYDWRAVVVCGPGEESLARRVADAAGAAFLPPADRGLAVLKPLVASSELLLVGDSGPRWYAAAFDVPCVSVMGPNFPELTASSLEWCEIVRHEGLECAPCIERVCPLGHHRCMRDLPPDRVVAAAERLIRRATVETSSVR